MIDNSIDSFEINMQVPAKPNYNLVMYYAAERQVNKDSLLGRFIDGTDAFRDARFKLIPSIVEVCITLMVYHIAMNTITCTCELIYPSDVRVIGW